MRLLADCKSECSRRVDCKSTRTRYRCDRNDRNDCNERNDRNDCNDRNDRNDCNERNGRNERNAREDYIRGIATPYYYIYIIIIYT